MRSGNLRSAFARDTFDCQNHQDTNYKLRDNNNAHCEMHGRKLKGRIFSSLALMLNVYYANENYLCDTENNVLFIHGVNQAYQCLRNVFSGKNESTELNSSSAIVELQIDEEEDTFPRYDRKQLWYPSFVSKYLQDCQRMNGNSLCKSMIRITSSETTIFFAGSLSHATIMEDQNEELMRVANLMVKLQKYLKQKYQRVSESPRNHSFCKSPKSLLSTKDKSTGPPILTLKKYCDKGIQCLIDTEFLQVSSDLKFFSRSSLVINVEPTNNKKKLNRHRQPRCRDNPSKESHAVSIPSLEYVANYRPEFRRQGKNGAVPNLRCLSSSAIFGLQPGDAATSLPQGFSSSRDKYNSRSLAATPKIRSRRESYCDSERVKETIRLTENEMLNYSNLIEDDLISFHRNTKFRGGKKSKFRNSEKEDILAVKKILLEDYITEVKEIIRSEARNIENKRETKILKSVKKRMDDDLKDTSLSNLSAGNESWHSLMPCTEAYEQQTPEVSPCKSKTSYMTARGTSRNPSCCCCHHRGFYKEFKDSFSQTQYCDGGLVDECLYTEFASSSKATRPRCRSRCLEEVLKSWVNYSDNDRNIKEDQATTSTTGKSSRSVDSGVLVDFPCRRDSWPSSEESSSHVHLDDRSATSGEKNPEQSCESSAGSCTDEILCQRVESAVRKFTEELILCERRARDRSRSKKKRRDKYKPHTPLLDQSFPRSPFNYLRSSSEDEPIAGISTPSLVSLSDSEIPMSPRT